MFCPVCGTENLESARECTSCGRSFAWRDPSSAAPEAPAGVGLLIPWMVDPVAVVAGYLGLLGFFFVGLVGPVAVGLGIYALVRIKHSDRLGGVVRAWTGIVLGALQTVLILFIIIAMIA